MHALAMAKKDLTSFDTLYELSQEQERSLGRGKFIYHATDEESKVNLNLVSQDRLGHLPGLNLALAENVARSSLMPMQVKEELLLVDGITEGIFLQCRDFVTVYSDGKININTAPAEVLKTLDWDESLVQMVCDFRKGPDQIEATKDDGVFENTAEVITKLRSFGGLSPEQESALSEAISGELITVESKNFSLVIETQVLDRGVGKYTVVIGGDKIKQWSE